MAKISREEILKLAELAKLELSEQEVNKYSSEIGEILSYVAQLQSVDIKGLEPTYQVTGLKKVTRSDKVTNYAASPDSLLKLAPKKQGRYIKVKRVL